ncbi:MAG: CPBP family glutamic-type intramembrane protease, partial [Verrucomicrobia bacterium]|nr:CPBP family glutamic-type intramembrane protease [Verrucomicrobiota bacterium]
ETGGEIALGLAGQQSRLTWLAALYSVAAAPIIEELIFRGWLVVENRGRAMAWAGAAGASALFAVLHPFLWRQDEAGWALTLDAKGWFSTAAVFAMSLWLYAARLATWNPARSLLPCFAAHAAKNLGVVVVKLGAGFMGGLW